MARFPQLRSIRPDGLKELRPQGLEDIVPTMITDEYQADQWGVRRVALDGIQNHLPGDSKGTKVSVEFLSKGTWIPYEQRAGLTPAEIEAIRFSDDGIGFSYELLGLFKSTKKGDEAAVGQFGEGIKMLSAAALRENLGLELQSRDWSAVPFFTPFDIEGNTGNKLQFEIYKPVQRQGSSTTFWTPTPAFSQYVLDLEQTVLHLSSTERRIFTTPHGAILGEHDKGRIFVKGVHITDSLQEKLLFGYDLLANTNRDRNVINEYILNNQIGNVLRDLTQPELIKRLLTEGRTGKEYSEFRALYWKMREDGCGQGGYKFTHPDIWKNLFYEVYGEKAVLSAQDDWNNGDWAKKEAADKLAVIAGKKIINLNRDLSIMLAEAGVQRSTAINADENAKLLEGEQYDPNNIALRIAPTSLTTKYRMGAWNGRRILLDTLANHMPTDTGGRSVTIEYLVTQEDRFNNSDKILRWKKEHEKSFLDEIHAVRISDDGTGYATAFLELLLSSKAGTEAVGQFGEGLKMLCTAFLTDKQAGMKLKLRSRDWVAMPFATHVEADGTTAQRLNFRIAEGLQPIRGSSTTIYEPTSEILKVLRELPQHVLTFNQDYTYKKLASGQEGAAFNGETFEEKSRIKNGAVFVRDFRITDDFKDHLLFSYNLTSRDIAPDRNTINMKTVREAVHALVAQRPNQEMIEKIVATAKDNKQDIYEYDPITFPADGFGEAHKDYYRETFHKRYGEKAVLYGGNPFLFAVATHHGYKPINMHPGVRETLHNAGVLTDSEVLNQGFTIDYVDPKDLTPEEQAVLGHYQTVNQCLAFQDTGAPTIYASVRAKNGEELPYAGFHDPNKKPEEAVHIRRDQLRDLRTFVGTYSHEKNHQKTRASDPEDEFRQAFEDPLADRVTKEVEKRKL
ncbi:MAG: hypothetical protein Q7R96_03900 [Nanoarchaeota archaeon]|nr:hypothetical protein [Nanoarchaeota archaeon]